MKNLTVTEMEKIYTKNKLKPATTPRQKKFGSVAFVDTVATSILGIPIIYIFNTRSGFIYRKVGSTPSYPINKRNGNPRQYHREYKRATAMKKALGYIGSFRERNM